MLELTERWPHDLVLTDGCTERGCYLTYAAVFERSDIETKEGAVLWKRVTTSGMARSACKPAVCLSEL